MSIVIYEAMVFFLIGMAIWNRRFAWVIDLTLLAFVPFCPHPPTWIVAIVMVGVGRRWPRWLARDLARKCRADRMPDHLLMVCFPGSRTGTNQPRPSSSDTGSPHQNQIEPSEPAQNEPDNRAATIDYLTRLRAPDGGYLYSANAILKLVGGTAAEVKAQIKAIRDAESPRSQGHVSRPNRGW